jgi:hypothetical protein
MLDALLHRLLETPGDFLRGPRRELKHAIRGELHVDALASDTLRGLGGERLTSSAAAPLRRGARPQKVNALRLCALACWLLNDPWFAARADLAPKARRLLLGGLDEFARVVDAEACVNDPDRREELARLVLRRLGLRPRGESAEVAQDRLSALDSVERLRVTQAALKAEKRAREIREKAARAAREAASYYGRE